MKKTPNGAPAPKQEVNNRPEQLNRNNDAFWQSRGYPARPPDWETHDPQSPPPIPVTKK